MSSRDLAQFLLQREEEDYRLDTGVRNVFAAARFLRSANGVMDDNKTRITQCVLSIPRSFG